MALYDDKDAISMLRETAETLRYLCSEGKVGVDTVIGDLIDMAGGADMASVAIFHRHNEPINEEPDENYLRDITLRQQSEPLPDE
ncbi:MAG: hypothetical protein ACYCSS_14655 [Sulfuriferula sp.]